MRLAKFIQEAGVTSRRKAETLIFSGKVEVNGKVKRTPQYEISPSDQVTLDGNLLELEKEQFVFVLNKPRGYLCTNGAGRRRVVDLFQDVPARLFTVGRLDKETEGLLLVTNNGAFAQRVIHPSANLQKEYIAKADQDITHEHLVKLSEGMKIEGTFVRPHLVKKVRRSTVRIVLYEGKKREVRRLLENVGLATCALKRVRIGNLRLGTLPAGAYRRLSEKEQEALFPKKTTKDT